MKRLALALLVLTPALVLSGCAHPAPQQPQRQQQQPARLDVVADVISQGIELREERVHLVTIKMQKSSFTLDLWEHLSNAATAEYRTIVVGEKQYNEYKLGQELSSKFDGWGFLFDGDVSTYDITVDAKETQSEYFAVMKDGTGRKLSKTEYDLAREQLTGAGKNTHTVSAMGAIRTYVLEQPLAQTQLSKVEPLKRYFVTVEVSNSTLTLDWGKHIRNLANAHEITLEVPKVVYESSSEVFEPQPSWGSLFLSGRLSMLSGKILKKWEEADSQYVLATLPDARTIVVPRSMVSEDF